MGAVEWGNSLQVATASLNFYRPNLNRRSKPKLMNSRILAGRVLVFSRTTCMVPRLASFMVLEEMHWGSS